MHKFPVPAAIIAGALATAGGASAYTGQQYAGEAKISLPEARATALKTRPGIVTDQELERERGGSGLRFSFDVKSGGKIYEVGVDAKTGAVLENSKEGPNGD